jgi:hypothetical protein
MLPAMAEVLVLEGAARAFCRIPLVDLTGPQVATDQRHERMYAFLVTKIVV